MRPASCTGTPEATRAAILAAMGEGAATETAPAARALPPVRVVGPRDARTLPAGGDFTLTLEDGTTLSLAAGAALPADLPFGYHRLRRHPDAGGGEETLLLVTPGCCHWPDDLRTWGWAAQVYAARSRESWGIGDLADLRRLGRWSRQTLGRRGDGQPAVRAGATFAHRTVAVLSQQPALSQPAVPAHRGDPGGRNAGARAGDGANAGRALNVRRRIERDAVFALKAPLLERSSISSRATPNSIAY